MPPHAQKSREILERRKKVAARYLRGQTQWEIARAFEVNQATIARDLQVIQADWEASGKSKRHKWLARQLATIDEVERQAWSAWAKSQENVEVWRARMRGDKSESEKIIKGQAGDPRFLKLVLECVKQRCDLLGLLHLNLDGNGVFDADDSGLGELAVRLREAVERCRARAGAESPADPAGADAAPGSAADGRSGDAPPGGDDTPLAGEIAPFFD